MIKKGKNHPPCLSCRKEIHKLACGFRNQDLKDTTAVVIGQQTKSHRLSSKLSA
jgi:hypothetical protein